MRKCLTLLMFALLRSSACSIRQVAPVTSSGTGPAASAATTTATTSIQLRLATRTDVPAIQRCNLACLPENYNQNFYSSHLRQWPDLALVAEEIHHHPQSNTNSNENQFSGFTSPQQQQLGRGRNYNNRNNNNNNNNNREPKIVAYVLGKVETRPSIDYSDPTSSSSSSSSLLRSSGRRVERLGHVTSLAVQKDFRRLGLARAMMTQLHHHLLQHHGISSCGLHVRTSNGAACRLYKDDGYEVDRVIEGYYQDGEDAYFMRRVFRNGSSSSSSSSEQQQEQQQREHRSAYEQLQYYRPGRLVKKAWKHGPAELRLPRIHVVPSNSESNSNSDGNSNSNNSNSNNSNNREVREERPIRAPPGPASAELLSGI